MDLECVFTINSLNMSSKHTGLRKQEVVCGFGCGVWCVCCGSSMCLKASEFIANVACHLLISRVREWGGEDRHPSSRVLCLFC